MSQRQKDAVVLTGLLLFSTIIAIRFVEIKLEMESRAQFVGGKLQWVPLPNQDDNQRWETNRIIQRFLKWRLVLIVCCLLLVAKTVLIVLQPVASKMFARFRWFSSEV